VSVSRVDISNFPDNCLIESKNTPRTGHSLSSYWSFALFVRVIHPIRTTNSPYSYWLFTIFVRVIFPFFIGFFPPLSRGLEQGQKGMVRANVSLLVMLLVKRKGESQEK